MATKKTKEEAKEALATLKEERKAAREELRAFEKENKLAKGEDHSADATHGKRWGKLNAAVQKKEKAVEAAEADVKETKSEGGTARASKYEYPADVVTAADKKKYRTKMRAEKAKADKPAKEEKVKKDKKVKPEEGATAEAAPKAKKKKAPKETVEVDED